MSTARESLPNEIHGLEERRDLQLLKEVQRVMSDALNSLAGHSHKTKEEAYVWWASVAVNRAAEGFHCLRESGRADASKLLVRPTIELVFAAEAVIRQRGFWFSKAYSEWLEDKKLAVNDAKALADLDNQMADLKQRVLNADPSYPIKCQKVTVRDSAEIAGLVDVYDSAYRLYCQFTHGAFRAIEGSLNQATDSADTATVAWCVLRMLDLMKVNSPASVPDLIPYKKRLPLLRA